MLPAWATAVGLGATLAVGALAGWYPALRAARVVPAIPGITARHRVAATAALGVSNVAAMTTRQCAHGRQAPVVEPGRTIMRMTTIAQSRLKTPVKAASRVATARRSSPVTAVHDSGRRRCW